MPDAKSDSKSDLQNLLVRLSELDRNIALQIADRIPIVQSLIAFQASPSTGLAQRIAQCQQSVASLPTDCPLNRELAHQLMAHIAWVTEHSIAKPDRVAYLGPIYSYSYLAAIRQFGMSGTHVAVASIPAVFEEIIRDHAQWGVVPIENSTDGRIVDTLTMFARSPLKICGEIQLPIHHYLLGRCERSEIRQVYSKPQAISQCRAWLSQHLPAAKIVDVDSTTVAAEMAAEQEHVAAIASQEAGMHYGLNVIDACIEDNPNNLTRFAIIGKKVPGRTGHDKTAIMFQVTHRPGALADAMNIFRSRDLNLTWIESFPIPSLPNEYLFFIEFEGHQENANAADAIDSLRKQAIRIEVLGSYPAKPMQSQ
jgi:chorismate mutase / prephenate dehydratase